MRSNALVMLLSLAPLARTAPVPMVLVQDLGPPTLGAHPPAPIALKPGQTLADVLRDHEDGAAQVAFDNRPFTPSSTVAPSVALASPQPVATTYLLSLSMRRPRPAAPSVELEEFVVVEGQEAATVAEGFATTAESSMGVPQDARRLGMSCWYTHAHRSRGDLLAVSLVAIFLFVIVVVETWDKALQRRSATNRRQGPICLETDEYPSEKKQLLSIQADAIEGAKTGAGVAL